MEKAVVTLPELESFAAECAATLRGGEVIALIGNLGAGKTTFTKALLKAAGVRKRITSPTFGIMGSYEAANKTFYHVDLYRIESAQEFRALGIADTWQQPNTVYIIEWADKITRLLPKGTIIMRFSHLTDISATEKRALAITTK